MLEDNPESLSDNGSWIVMQPPDNACNSITDEDSGDEEHVTINNLPSSQLRGAAEVQVESDDNSDPADEPQPSSSKGKQPRKKKRILFNWTKGDLLATRLVWSPADIHDPVEQTPVELFSMFFNEQLLNDIVFHTNTYAAQKNLALDVTAEEIESFIGILLLSGYVQLPRRRMYWEKSVDTHNALVASSMSRNRFEQILSNIHVVNNETLNKDDKFAKVRPLFEHLNKKFVDTAPREENHSIDEAMVPYFGRHGCKQFIRGKPIRYGFKLWVGATRFGYVVWMEPYQGAGTVIDPSYKDMGLGAGVILQYASVLSTIGNDPYHLYFDNFFTSIPLLCEIAKRNMNGTGTIRENRTSQCPLSDRQAMKKTERGTYNFRVTKDENIVVCRWNDNSVVTLASTSCAVQPIHSVSRYSQKLKKNVNITQPHIVKCYNENMGGVDRSDQNISLYRISIRGKKWYFALLAQCIDVAEQNSWQLHKARGGNLDHLSFRRRVATALLERNGRSSGATGRPSKSEHVDSRYDRLDHLVQPQDSQTRCRHCHAKCTTRCGKCDVGLHVKCFQTYHTK